MTPASKVLAAWMPSELWAEPEPSRQERCPKGLLGCVDPHLVQAGPQGWVSQPKSGRWEEIEEAWLPFPSLSFPFLSIPSFPLTSGRCALAVDLQCCTCSQGPAA